MEHSFDQVSKVGLSSALTDSVDLLSFLEISPLPALIIDAESRIISANLTAEQFLNAENEKPAGKRLADFLNPPESIAWIDKRRRTSDETVQSERCEFLFEDGSTVWGEVSARFFPDGRGLLLINNITDRKRAEKRLLASEKQKWKMQRTEALENLAGGIAHDFNNFLAVILLQTDLMSLHLPENSPLFNRVAEIRAVSNDAASIVRHLLAFGRRQALNPVPVVLNKVLENSLRDFRALLGEKIELNLSLDPALGVSFVDPGQIAQALMYLAINAKDAMPDGGRFAIKTINIDRGGPRIHKTQSTGAYVQIEVTDTGIGMDPKTADHIFEPFFSKKASKKSAGLGLATVYGIIKQSGGFIWVTSVQDSGTTFKIQFPRIDQPKISSDSPADAKVVGQMQTVILIDDEISIRKVAAEGLRQSGYRVLEAANGMDAVDIARTFPDPIHLILADYSMPVMNGVETAKRIKQFHTDALILYMSGDPGSLAMNVNKDANLLGKPFSLSGLAEKVRKVLAG